MQVIHYDAPHDDEARRIGLYGAEIFVYSPTQTTRDYCAFADEMCREAFDGLAPELAQHEIPVERMVEILKDLKPRFIHHPESKRFLESILAERGCDPDDIHYDVPRLRTSTSNGYLTSGIAYAWHPHRDTWYSAPRTQLNWWMPVYPMESGNGMCFFFDYFDRNVPNDSSCYNYQEWNQKFRFAAADQVKRDERPLPRPHDEIPSSHSTTLVTPVGGLVVFSAAQLHASVENVSSRTRFSIDFRTVSLSDTRRHGGAPIQDVHCTGSSIRDFKRLHDCAEVPEKLASEMERVP